MKRIAKNLAAACALFACASAALASGGTVELLLGDGAGGPVQAREARPLDTLVVQSTGHGRVEVRDSKGRVYFAAETRGRVSFLAGGSPGAQTVSLVEASGALVSRSSFELKPDTSIEDSGKYRAMFDLFRSGMNAYSADGVQTEVWNHRTYRFFVNWGLDNYHTTKGMRYFSPWVTDLLDMMRETQREDGMIWSNLNEGGTAYYNTAYGPFGYVRKYGDRTFVRQPAENHPEYIYVSSIYQTWKTTGDSAWMRASLASAMRALEYSVTDRSRWSRRFSLLKRVYTIDSWDFQVDDAYTPDIGLTNTMLIDPDRSKFGVFFGDNVYYAAACEELAEMLASSGDEARASRYRDRASEIRKRLDALSWNGRFYTHFIDEDPTVHRDLGVDERTQIAQGNAYALNRGIGLDHAAAIIRTYQDLRAHLPPGSPGEWYAIYPPFGKGFSHHDEVWQYMNGGVGGHVAGELARGALENGFESYGRDILDRLAALGERTGHKIAFAYTGAYPPPPPPAAFSPVDLSRIANMDIRDRREPGSVPWMLGGKAGDDLRNLPTGEVVLEGVPYRVADPGANGGRVAVAVSHRGGLPPRVEVAVARKVGGLYLLHTSTKPTSEGVCGSVAFVYADGTSRVQYIVMGKQLTYWWFPELKTATSGVAWHGPSPVAADVGLSWSVIDNPEPEKLLAAVRLSAPEDDGIYVVAGLTLADRPHFERPPEISFGGPDNWAAATAMAALIEGLAGVSDSPGTVALGHPLLAPRWDPESGPIRVTVQYPASKGYAAYRYAVDRGSRTLHLTITQGGDGAACHVLVPAPARAVEIDGVPAEFRNQTVLGSAYADFAVTGGVHGVSVAY